MLKFLELEPLRAIYPEATDEELTRRAEEAEALARLYAPCLFSPAFDPSLDLNQEKVQIFRAIASRALAYDAGAGAGAVTRVSLRADSFGKDETLDTRQKQSGTLYSPAQIEALRGLCRPKIADAGAYSVPLGLPGL